MTDKNKRDTQLNLANSPPGPNIVSEKAGRQKSPGMDTIDDHPPLIFPYCIHAIFCRDEENADLA